MKCQILNKKQQGKLAEKVQEYLSPTPLVVLGSGASIPHGLPSMDDLAKNVEKYLQNGNLETFKQAMKKKDANLESALEACNLQDKELQKIRIQVYQEIQSKDKAALQDFLLHGKNFPLKNLCDKMLKTDQRPLSIVTTNYDRLAEYAVDLAGGIVCTGFSGYHIKKFNDNESFSQFNKRNIHIWKLHGSIDWAMNIKKGTKGIYSSPVSDFGSDAWQPGIILPGNSKYKDAWGLPYSSLISRAQKMLASQKTFLCIGYGYRDEHIQGDLESLLEEGKGKCVVITKEATFAWREMLTKSPHLIIFEDGGKGNTRVLTSDKSLCGIVEKSTYWCLDDFIKFWVS